MNEENIWHVHRYTPSGAQAPALLPWMRKVPLLLEPNVFFIHQYLRIKMTLSVINSPQMCFDIWRGIYLSSCQNFAPTCSAALTSPTRPSLLLLLLLHLVLIQIG